MTMWLLWSDLTPRLEECHSTRIWLDFEDWSLEDTHISFEWVFMVKSIYKWMLIQAQRLPYGMKASTNENSQISILNQPICQYVKWPTNLVIITMATNNKQSIQTWILSQCFSIALSTRRLKWFSPKVSRWSWRDKIFMFTN